jgi:5-methylcytosine-specific restriction endonuclease McrA
MKKIPTFDPGPTGGVTYQPKAEPDRRPAEDRERRKFYRRAAWLRCRALKLAKDPACERCLATTGRGVDATDVHHKIDLKDEPSLAYDLANLESLCHRCHGRITGGRIRRGGAS